MLRYLSIFPVIEVESSDLESQGSLIDLSGLTNAAVNESVPLVSLPENIAAGCTDGSLCSGVAIKMILSFVAGEDFSC